MWANKSNPILIARYEEGGSFPKPRSWANCDELGSPYQFFPRYGVSNSSQLAQLLGFGNDPPSSYLAIKFSAGSGYLSRGKSLVLVVFDDMPDN